MSLSQPEWIITILNIFSNIRYSWQHNPKGRLEHYSHNKTSQCRLYLLCAEISFPGTSLARHIEGYEENGGIFSLLLPLRTCTLHLILVIHLSIAQLECRQLWKKL